jgi:N-acetylglucosaminyl-diphospho-decaprenol L-rhamnosyltransferase
MSGQIALSIVSHGHGVMVEELVESVLQLDEIGLVRVTLNLPESLRLPADERIRVTENSKPRGFGANHNAAFKHCDRPFFCPLNPDIRLPSNPFPQLLGAIQRSGAALVAPLVEAPSGSIEDSIRYFPTPMSLSRKALGRSDGRYSLKSLDNELYPDWVAGMFMLFRSDCFAQLGGFDEKFFLYYEDVDICARAWKQGMKVLACTNVRVIHEARRASRREPRYMWWHLRSLARYFRKHLGRLPPRSLQQPS